MSQARRGWLIALSLLVSGRSVAKTAQADVPAPESVDLMVQPVKTAKTGTEDVTSTDLLIRPVKTVKQDVPSVAGDDIMIRATRLTKIGFDGLDGKPKKPADLGDDAAEQAVNMVGKNASPSSQVAAANVAANVAASQARADGLGGDEVHAAAEAARKKVQKDFAPDAGAAEAAPAAATPSVPSGPEVLEAPPAEGAGAEPGVVDVPSPSGPGG